MSVKINFLDNKKTEMLITDLSFGDVFQVNIAGVYYVAMFLDIYMNDLGSYFAMNLSVDGEEPGRNPLLCLESDKSVFVVNKSVEINVR